MERRWRVGSLELNVGMLVVLILDTARKRVDNEGDL